MTQQQDDVLAPLVEAIRNVRRNLPIGITQTMWDFHVAAIIEEAARLARRMAYIHYQRAEYSGPREALTVLADRLDEALERAKER